MDERLYWIGFNLVKGIGAVRFQSILDHFSDAKPAWDASPAELAAAGLGGKVIERFIELRSTRDLENFRDQIQKQGIQVLIRPDAAYPAQLKEIEQPPPVLYIKGEITQEDRWAVVIVSTRQVTAYGRQVTEDLAGVLAHNGVTVVSGLVRGVDAIAHAAAIKAGGRTLAVLGSGLDKVYPPNIDRWRKKSLGRVHWSAIMLRGFLLKVPTSLRATGSSVASPWR